MLDFLKKVRKLLYSFSYFQATQFFRFRKQQAFVHSSAGVCSLLLRLIIGISLYYNLLAVFQRQSVSASSSKTYYAYPPKSTIIDQSNNFMVAIEQVNRVAGLQIKFFQNKQTRRSKNKKLLANAQFCTIEHWIGVGLTIEEFKNRKIQNWLCMPRDTKLYLQGAKYEKIYTYFSIEIGCQNCSFSEQNPIQLILHYSNPMINPSESQNYITYYINSDEKISMTPQTSNYFQIFMQDYLIQSDTSILPWSSYKSQEGLIKTTTEVSRMNKIENHYFSKIIFKKSSKSTTYIHNFLKILDAFYFIIGSFASTVIAFAFFIQPILISIFQMRFATCLYRLQEGRKFGILDAISQNFFKFLKKICEVKSQKWDRVQQIRQILSKVMEVQYLYERINFLQRSLKIIFKDHQLDTLRLIQKDNIIEAHEKYKKYQIRKNIRKYITNEHYKQIKAMMNDHDSLLLKNTLEQSISSSQMSQTGRLNMNKEEYKYESRKYFGLNDSDNEMEQINIEQNRESYIKIISDYKKLKQQAESPSKDHQLSRLIYQQLKQNDIELIQQFSQRMKIQKGIKRNRSQSMNIQQFQYQIKESL